MTTPTPTEEQNMAAAKFFHNLSVGAEDMSTLAALLAEREAPLREAHQRACETIAAMHAAAVGSVRGPIVGVVEDVAAMRERAEKAEAKIDAIERDAAEDARLQVAVADALIVERDADRAEVARLTALLADAEASVARKKALIDETARRHVAAERALAASCAEVEALRAALRDLVEQMHERPQPYVDGITFTTGTDVFAYYDAARAALSSTPAPASAVPATPTTEGGAK